MELLSPISYLRPALEIPYSHHERWDGTGYPLGLSGKQIPLSARIFAVIDVWDALCSDRPYRKGWPLQRVLKHIRDGAGTHFDPQVVEAFLQMHPPIEEGDEPKQIRQDAPIPRVVTASLITVPDTSPPKASSKRATNPDVIAPNLKTPIVAPAPPSTKGPLANLLRLLGIGGARQ
jgi:hypothetical protein